MGCGVLWADLNDLHIGRADGLLFIPPIAVVDEKATVGVVIAGNRSSFFATIFELERDPSIRAGACGGVVSHVIKLADF